MIALPIEIEQNSNQLDRDGLIRNTYVGNQTVTTLKKSLDELRGITQYLSAKKRKILILTDIRSLGKVPLSARSFAVEFIKQVDFDKVAIFGNKTFFEQIANVIIISSGRGFKMRYFTSEKEAKSWLLE